MSKNKLAKFAEIATFPHVFQVSSNEILSGKTFDFQGNWNKNVFKNTNPIVVELGCGKGEYTVELAARYPDHNFIGVDIKGARIWTGAKRSFEAKMKNVAFIRTDIEMISRFFAPAEVSEIWLTFPDPQMKKTNKRLTSTNFMKRYQQFVENEGIIHLKTDSNFLFIYTKEMIKANDYQVITAIDDLYANAEAQNYSPLCEIQTFYEKQWLHRGISIKYIAFKLTEKQKFIEPQIEIEKDAYRSFGRNAKLT
ncbi:MAG: tRNA (guanosine(46)-N7)-methyltransferase TrmB [Prevotellaceae bacterium]|jgi:tRNA (guanine-N7-)-methyltransferase|nr:tRNA (guanosine(46)-N7)-methyltransferase TrmB [Prevotellaceae bacterium]